MLIWLPFFAGFFFQIQVIFIILMLIWLSFLVGFFLDTSIFYYFNVDLSFGFGGLFLDTFFYLF